MGGSLGLWKSGVKGLWAAWRGDSDGRKEGCGALGLCPPQVGVGGGGGMQNCKPGWCLRSLLPSPPPPPPPLPPFSPPPPLSSLPPPPLPPFSPPPLSSPPPLLPLHPFSPRGSGGSRGLSSLGCSDARAPTAAPAAPPRNRAGERARSCVSSAALQTQVFSLSSAPGRRRGGRFSSLGAWEA